MTLQQKIQEKRPDIQTAHQLFRAIGAAISYPMIKKAWETDVYSEKTELVINQKLSL